MTSLDEGEDLVEDKCVHELSRAIVNYRNAAVTTTIENIENKSVLFICSKDLKKRIAEIRSKNLRIVICDPKVNSSAELDLIENTIAYIVSSIEQQSCWSWTNKRLFILPMFKMYTLPKSIDYSKDSKNKKEITILYHGNRVHFENFLARSHKIVKELCEFCKFVTVYNFEKLGRYNPINYNLPKEKFRHVQYGHESLIKESARADLGLVPNLLPSKTNIWLDIVSLKIIRRKQMFELFDHTLRFKTSSNSGRCHLFALANIPVIAEATPSSCNLIENSVDGFIYMNNYDLKSVIHEDINLSFERRLEMSKKLRAKFRAKTKHAQTRIIDFLSDQITIKTDESELAEAYRKEIITRKRRSLLGKIYLRAHYQ